MKKQNGFYLAEFLTVIIIGLILFSIIFNAVVNNRGYTEARALDGAQLFIDENNLSVKRVTCAGDSDGDGYGSCAVTLSDGERIRLDCPSNWGDINIWGASRCKEVFYDVQGGALGLPAIK